MSIRMTLVECPYCGEAGFLSLPPSDSIIVATVSCSVCKKTGILFFANTILSCEAEAVRDHEAVKKRVAEYLREKGLDIDPGLPFELPEERPENPISQTESQDLIIDINLGTFFKKLEQELQKDS